MAADHLPHVPNESLIAFYDLIGNARKDDNSYRLTEFDTLVTSAMSKRKLIHKSRYKLGLPKSSKWR